MKLSVVIAGESAPENAFVVWRGYEQSIKKARYAGYDGVELALGGADDIDMAKLDEWLAADRMAVSCISTGLVYAQRGLYMTHPDAAVRTQTVEVFRGLITLAARYGRLVNVGRARGFVGPGQTRGQAEGLFMDCFERLLPMAEALGVTLLIEPVNRYESNFINCVDEAAALLAGFQSANVGIMADVFHMNIEDDSIAGALTRNSRWIGYVHIADSNRKAPGMGHTDFEAVLAALAGFGYEGWLGVEILPGGNPDAMAARAAAEMRRLMA